MGAAAVLHPNASAALVGLRRPLRLPAEVGTIYVPAWHGCFAIYWRRQAVKSALRGRLRRRRCYNRLVRSVRRCGIPSSLLMGDSLQGKLSGRRHVPTTPRNGGRSQLAWERMRCQTLQAEVISARPSLCTLTAVGSSAPHLVVS